MRLRYYLRGLGIGIIVTAVIMGVSSGRNNKMSDEEIKKRAAELGMIENTVLAPPTEAVTPIAAPTETVTPTVTPATAPTEAATPTTTLTEAVTATATPTAAPTGTVTPTTTPTAAVTPTAAPTEAVTPTTTPTEAVTPTAAPTEAITPTVTPEAAAGEDQTVTITIYGGEGSGTVSRKAAQAGLVDDAADFDSYLCKNGYDRHLAVGNHVIALGATYEEIAAILVSRPQ